MNLSYTRHLLSSDLSNTATLTSTNGGHIFLDIFFPKVHQLAVPSGLAGGSVGQRVAATEEEQPSHPSRRSRSLLPAGGLLSLCIAQQYMYMQRAVLMLST